MPATTPVRGLPYPVTTDLINVPADVERLARAVDGIVGTETMRRYPSVAARQAANPVPQEGQQCYCVVAPGVGQGMRFIGRGGEWWALGMCVYAGKVSTTPMAADAVWQLIPYTQIYWNVLSSYNGSTWTSPFKGYVRVTHGFAVTIGTGGVPADVHASSGISNTGSVVGGDTFFGRWAQKCLKFTGVIAVSVGTTISAQAWVNAVGHSKAISGSPGDVTGFFVEYV